MGWISNPGSSVVTSSTNTWTAAQTFDAGVTLSDTGATATKGLTFGADVQLYRSAAGTLKFGGSAANIDGGLNDLVLQRSGVNGMRVRSGDVYFDTPPNLVSGVTPATAVSVNNYVAGQAPATSTQGTDTTPVSGTIFYGQVFIPANVTLTGISYLIGTVGGTNNVIVALYNNAGTLVKNSATAGTLVGTLATMQRVPFTSTYAALGPAMYWVSISMNGTTARLRTHTFGDHACASATGVFGTLGSIAPPTTFTANTAPYAMTY